MLSLLRDERRPIFERAGLAEQLLRYSWEPTLELSSADEASAQRLLTKAGMSPDRHRFSTLQVIRYQPSPWLNLEAVDTCRAEVGLAPLDGGWPIEGANLEATRDVRAGNRSVLRGVRRVSARVVHRALTGISVIEL